MIMIKRKTWNIAIVSVPYVISTVIFLLMLNGDAKVDPFINFSLILGIVITQIVTGVVIIDELKSSTKISFGDYLLYLVFLVPIINAIIVYAAIIFGLGYLIKKGVAKVEKNNIID